MKIASTVPEMQALRRAADAGALGLVPTMGALHEGHVSLVKQCKSGNETCVVSIFVNPTQFDREDDLAHYPQPLEKDLDILRDLEVDVVFMPAFGDLYPDDFRYRLVETDLSTRLCGAHRPGHFDGVLTVVMRLLNIVRPDRAYFGEKDYQQLLLVRGMVEAFFLDVEIVACPIVRESDGLALSSRNRRLGPREREIAPGLHRVLAEVKDPAEAEQRLADLGFEVDYVEDFDGRRLAAASLGAIRLIDNVPAP